MLKTSFRFDVFLGRRDLGHGGLRHFHNQIVRWNPQVDAVILDGHNSAAQSAAGGYLVTGFKLVQHALPLLLTSLLRQDQKKVENREDKDERSDAEPSHTAAATELHSQEKLHGRLRF